MEIDAVLEVEAGDPQIAIDFLLANVNLSKSRLKELMNRGGVWRVTKDDHRERIRRAMTDILVGERIEIFYNEALFDIRPLHAELLLDMGQYSVWRKPNGMNNTGTDFGDFNTFSRELDYSLKPARDAVWLSSFDYDAIGVTLIAHSRKAASELTELFDPNGFKDCTALYRVDVTGECSEDGPLETLMPDGVANMHAKRLRYDSKPNRTQYDIQLHSAREHQIRRYFSSIDHHVVGESVYAPPSDDYEHLKLKLTQLVFTCPITGEKREFSA